ncbi:hypothetical protein BY458DRAFT_525332 [Sporodiniella umbellata]|nr:hypothetical protein BY458DRAFT_525332 [Sporodiniella umbellata]
MEAMDYEKSFEDGRWKEDSESDKDLYLFSLNESLQIHKEMVERVQSEKDELEEYYESHQGQVLAALRVEQEAVKERVREKEKRREQLEAEQRRLENEVKQKGEELNLMEGKFRSHLEYSRASQDDLDRTGERLGALLKAIHHLCEPNVAHEIFVTDKIVQEILTGPIQPGMPVNAAFGVLHRWVQKRNASWAARIRQQMAAFMARQSCPALEKAQQDLVHTIVVTLGIQDPSPVQSLVEHALELNLALKSQDAHIYTLPVSIGSPFDPHTMLSLSRPQGIVTHVISPPFMAAEADHCFLLMPAQVLCD